MLRFVLIFILAAFCLGDGAQVFQQSGRIVGGREVDILDYSYQLSLEEDGKYKCGAALIGPNVAVTAAHCTDRTSASSLRIRAGSSVSEAGGQIVNVAEVKQHPGYNVITADYDVSVLILTKSLNLGPGVKPIDLVEDNLELPVGTRCVASGWGALTTGGSFSQQLQAVEVPTISHSDCESAYAPNAPITENMLCTEDRTQEKDVCQGDSGSPLVCDGVLAGVVSWGWGCARPDEPSVFAKIAKLREFIREASGI